MKRQIRIFNYSDLNQIQNRLVESANETKEKLSILCSSKSGMDILYDMKFYQTGRDPIEERDLNIIEQLNQQFTYLVSVSATGQLLKKHPEDVPFIMNLGTAPGLDVVSENNNVAAEVFSSANPRNNKKLKADVERVQGVDAAFKYVFYHSPFKHSGEDKFLSQYPDVQIVWLKTLINPLIW